MQVVTQRWEPAEPESDEEASRILNTMSVSDVPSRPAWASHADNSAKKASFTPRLYSHNVRLWHF
jgi:hypothetical protein